jgi:hypothetical protein
MNQVKKDGYSAVLQESIRAISDQQVAVDVLGTRSGFVASAAALVASVSGTELLDGARTDWLLKLGLLSYLGVAFMTGYVLWPRRKWRFHFSAARLHWLYLEGPDPLAFELMQRDLALHLESYIQENAKQVDRMAWALAISIALLLAGTATLAYHFWT